MAEKDVYKAHSTWVKGMQFVGQGDASGISIVLDGAGEGGSPGGGARPTEALLLALAGCTGMDVISVLKKKREDVTGLELNVTGYRATEHPRRFTEIEVEYVVHGHGVKEAAVERAVELSQEKYCSVASSLNAEVRHTYRVVEAD